MERCCQRNRHSTSRLIPLEVFLMEEGCGAFHVAQSMPRVAVGVSREAEPRAAVDWDYKGAIKGRSILEKDCSCKNFIWDFVWVLHLEFHSNLYYSVIMYLLWETMQNENQKISVASSFNTRKFRIILPWSFQHERVRCSSALAALQSSWEVNCSPPPGIQPSPPMPRPLFSWELKSAKRNHKPCKKLTFTNQLSHFYTSTFPSFAEFPSQPRQLQARQVLLWPTLEPLWVQRRQGVFPGSSWQTAETSSHQKFSCWCWACDASSTCGRDCLGTGNAMSWMAEPPLLGKAFGNQLTGSFVGPFKKSLWHFRPVKHWFVSQIYCSLSARMLC